MGELKVIGSASGPTDDKIVAGDLALTWRKDSPAEVAAAAETFSRYVDKGWLAFGETCGDKELIFTFNPDLEKITLFPMLMGG